MPAFRAILERIQTTFQLARIRRTFQLAESDYATGNLTAALAEWNTVITSLEALRRDLEAAGQWTPTLVNELARAFVNHGIAHYFLGQPVLALADYDQAIALLKILRQDLEPSGQYSPELANELATTYSNRGVTHVDLGQLSLALADHDQSIALREALRQDLEAASQWTPVLANGLAGAYNNRGIAHANLDQLSLALADYDRSIALYEAQRQDLEPEGQWTPALAKKLARVYHNRSNAYDDLGQLSLALADSDRSIALYEAQRRDLEPAGQWTPEFANELARTYSGRGNTHHALGQLSLALADHDRSIAIGEALHRNLKPSGQWTPEFTNELTRTYSNRGNVYSDLGELSLALADYDQSIALREALRRDLEPEGQWTPALAKELARVYHNRSNAYGDLGQLSLALADSDRSIALYEAQRRNLEPSGQYSPKFANELAMTYSNRGVTHVALGRLAAALADYDRGDERSPSGPVSLPDWTAILCRLYVNAAVLLPHRPDPLGWARKRSQRITTLLETPPPPDIKQHDPYGEARQGAALFHALWMDFCIQHDYLNEIPHILAAIQGRHLAALVLDELETLQETSETPAPVREYQRVRLELRKLAARIKAIIGDDRPSGGLSEPRATVAGGKSGLLTEGQRKTLEELQAQYQALQEDLDAKRPLAAAEAGYEALQLPHERIDTPALQATLSDGEALALIIDLQQEGISHQGVWLLTTQGYCWLAMQGLDQATAQLQQIEVLRSRGRGYRKGREIASDDRPETTQDLDELWTTLQAGLERDFWVPLLPHLDGVRHLSVVTHGRLHLLPLELGQPEHLTLTYFPGLIFFAQARRILPQPQAHTNWEYDLGLLHYAGDENDPPIPLTEAECDVLDALYRVHGCSRLRPVPYDKGSPLRLRRLHAATHGVPLSQKSEQVVALKTGANDQRLDTSTLYQSQIWVEEAFLSACIGGRTEEDLEGNPSGLISAFFLRGTKRIVASLLPVSDEWMPLLALLTHQTLLARDCTLDRAFAEAKERLAAGYWYPDTLEQLRQAIDPVRARDRQRKREAWKEVIGRAKVHAERGGLDLWSDVLAPQLQRRRRKSVSRQRVLPSWGSWTGRGPRSIRWLKRCSPFPSSPKSSGARVLSRRQRCAMSCCLRPGSLGRGPDSDR